MQDLDHDWFNQQLATYLANGLSAEERSRFEAHAAECPACAQELQDARSAESNLHELFSEIHPAANFEDRMASRFRNRTHRKLHPRARQAAVAAAAAIMLGALGYLSEQAIQNGNLVSPQQIAVDLQGIEQAYLGSPKSPPAARAPATQPFMGSYDDHDNVLLPLDEPAPQSGLASTNAGEKWDFGGGRNSGTNWSGGVTATTGGVSGRLEPGQDPFPRLQASSFTGGGTIYGGVSHESVQTISDVSSSGLASRDLGVSGANGYGLTVGRLNVRDGVAINGSSSLSANGIVNGSGGITKTGAGALAYSGTTSVQAGLPGFSDKPIQLGGAIRLNGAASAGTGTVNNLAINTNRESGTHGTVKVVPVTGELNTNDVVHPSSGAPMTTDGIVPGYIAGQKGTDTQLGFASLSGGKAASFDLGAVSGASPVDVKTSNGIVNTGGGTSSLVYSGNRTLALNGAVGTGGDTYVTGGSTGPQLATNRRRGGALAINGGTAALVQSGTLDFFKPAEVAVDDSSRTQSGAARVPALGDLTPQQQGNRQSAVAQAAGSGPRLGSSGGANGTWINPNSQTWSLASNWNGGTVANAGGNSVFSSNAGSTSLRQGSQAELRYENGNLQRAFNGNGSWSTAENWTRDELNPALTVPNSVTFGAISNQPATQPIAVTQGRIEVNGAFTGARSYSTTGSANIPLNAPDVVTQGTHTLTGMRPTTMPITVTAGNNPIKLPTRALRELGVSVTGPNPTAAIERTELALANTQQPAQPQQGGAAVVVEGQQAQPQPAPQPAPVIIRRVIRDGVMEFEVDSFDSTFAVVAKITGEEGGFVVAADSDRLANGKVRGTITVRVPPDNLDTLILKLRALGDLKSQRLGSKDISKEYTDLESELRAGKAMEQRLLDMIKNAQGEVKDLLEAEKELANWRTKLEKIQGQMNYFNNLVAMATLTINAYEKDIRTPATATQSEEISTGIEAEDVDGARTAALKAIDEVKGRIIESTLQQMNAGQFAAKIVADVAPENAGQVVDRLRQIGKVARLDSQKKQTTGTGQTPPQGTSSPGVGPKVEQAPTRLIISIYNLANVAPRLTTNLNLASDDVEATYRTILARVNQADGRVVSSKLDRQDANNVSGAIQFEVKSPDADAVLNDIRQPVQVLRLNVTENPDTANVTTTKQGFTVQIIPTAQVTPRLTTNLNLAASDVEATYASILNQVRTSGGRVISSNLNRQDATQAVGSVQFEIKSTEADALMNELRKTVQVLTLNVSENTGVENITTTKQGFVMQIIPAAQVQPREVRALAVQTSTVDNAVQKATAAALAAGGRVLSSSMTQDENGAMLAEIAFEVPLDKLETVSDVAKAQGKVRTANASRNAQVPEGPLSRARINLTVGTGDMQAIVPQGGGFWDTIRGGLSTSIKGLLWSLQLIIIGLCLVAPWVLMVWGGVKWVKRNRRAKADHNVTRALAGAPQSESLIG